MKPEVSSLMSPFSFILPTAIRFGRGVIRSLPPEISAEGFKKALIITDAGVSALPLFKDMVEDLHTRGIFVRIYDGVEANPKDRNVRAGAEEAEKMEADCIVAVGGGSPIDCAKAVSVVAVQGGEPRDYEGGAGIETTPLPLYTVPTTAGTGSEITFSSVITDTRENFKFTVKSPLIAPKTAFLDPEATLSMPPALTASTGLDALTHAVEAYTAKNAEPIADAAALYAVELISAYLIPAVKEGADIEARTAMLAGSLLAGMAFSHSDVAAVHCLAEALGGIYDAPHGECNAIALPVMMEYNRSFALERYARIASAMGLSYSSPEEGAQLAVNKVRSLTTEAGLPSFRSLGVKEEDFEMLAEKSEHNGSNADNPRPMQKEDYLEVLRRLYTL
ncbi:MAG: iron-containing alcohol dehydrogenase [Spirochaetaceae bacterium]